MATAAVQVQQSELQVLEGLSAFMSPPKSLDFLSTRDLIFLTPVINNNIVIMSSFMNPTRGNDFPSL